MSRRTSSFLGALFTYLLPAILLGFSIESSIRAMICASASVAVAMTEDRLDGPNMKTQAQRLPYPFAWMVLLAALAAVLGVFMMLLADRVNWRPNVVGYLVAYIYLYLLSGLFLSSTHWISTAFYMRQGRSKGELPRASTISDKEPKSENRWIVPGLLYVCRPATFTAEDFASDRKDRERKQQELRETSAQIQQYLDSSPGLLRSWWLRRLQTALSKRSVEVDNSMRSLVRLEKHYLGRDADEASEET